MILEYDNSFVDAFEAHQAIATVLTSGDADDPWIYRTDENDQSWTFAVDYIKPRIRLFGLTLYSQRRRYNITGTNNSRRCGKKEKAEPIYKILSQTNVSLWSGPSFEQCLRTLARA